MLRGKNVDLKLVHEKDLEKLFYELQNFSSRGEHFPLFLLSEPLFKKEFYQSGFWTDDYRRMLVWSKEGELVGSIFSWKVNCYSDTHELAGMVFNQDWKNRGHAAESMRIYIDYLFRAYPLMRIQATATLDNPVAQRLAEKSGMYCEGIARKAIFLEGRHVDIKTYAVTRSDWEKGLGTIRSASDCEFQSVQ